MNNCARCMINMNSLPKKRAEPLKSTAITIKPSSKSLSKNVKSAKNQMISRKKDLHDGRAVWSDVELVHQPLTRDITTDIVVIGAGLTGAVTAQALAEAGYKVVLLDRRKPLRGSTRVTTALLQ